MPHQDDGKFVVVQDGKRVSGQLHEQKQTADTEAAKVKARQPVQEGGNQPAQQPKVVQNLYG